MTTATPEHYQVERVGTPDPEDSEYFVIDVVHDITARAILWSLVRAYRNTNAAHNAGGKSVKADELEALLEDTDQTVIENIASRNAPTKNSVGRPRSAKPTRPSGRTAGRRRQS